MTNIDQFIQSLQRSPPATDDQIAAFNDETGNELPQDYIEFLKMTDGGEGSIGKNSYVSLWRISDLLPLNRDYQVEAYAPGLLVFGSDGGGEAYGFDTRSAPWNVVEAPFVGMEWSQARPLGASFTEFLEHLYWV